MMTTHTSIVVGMHKLILNFALSHYDPDSMCTQLYTINYNMYTLVLLIHTYLVALTRGACARIPTLAFPSVNRRTDSTRDASLLGILSREDRHQ